MSYANPELPESWDFLTFSFTLILKFLALRKANKRNPNHNVLQVFKPVSWAGGRGSDLLKSFSKLGAVMGITNIAAQTGTAGSEVAIPVLGIQVLHSPGWAGSRADPTALQIASACTAEPICSRHLASAQPL